MPHIRLDCTIPHRTVAREMTLNDYGNIDINLRNDDKTINANDVTKTIIWAE